MSILAPYRRLVAAGLLITFSLLLSSCGNSLPAQHFRLLAFGTYVDIEIIGVDRATAQAAAKQLQADFDLMHGLWHAWEPGPLGRVNEYINQGETVAAPPSVLPLLKVSAALAERSDYLFDPGIGQLIKLWGFQTSDLQAHAPPKQETIDFWVEQDPSIRHVKVDGFHISSDNTATRLDFGAIGKGYGVDQAIARLREMGIDNAVVNAGGDLRAIGSRASNPWRIAVRNPQGGVFAIIPVTGNQAIFTSGNYERNFAWEGKFYHHILDPRTGSPVDGVASVTVMHPDATTADAAATALFVAGPDKWHEVAKKMGIRYAMLIEEDGTVHINPALRKRIEFQKTPARMVISDPLR